MKRSIEDLMCDRARLRKECDQLNVTAEKLQQQSDGILAQRQTVLNRIDVTLGKIHKLNLDISTLSVVRRILKPRLGRPRKMKIEIERVGDSETQTDPRGREIMPRSESAVSLSKT